MTGPPSNFHGKFRKFKRKPASRARPFSRDRAPCPKFRGRIGSGCSSAEPSPQIAAAFHVNSPGFPSPPPLPDKGRRTINYSNIKPLSRRINLPPLPPLLTAAVFALICACRNCIAGFVRTGFSAIASEEYLSRALGSRFVARHGEKSRGYFRFGVSAISGRCSSGEESFS